MTEFFYIFQKILLFQSFVAHCKLCGPVQLQLLLRPTLPWRILVYNCDRVSHMAQTDPDASLW